MAGELERASRAIGGLLDRARRSLHEATGDPDEAKLEKIKELIRQHRELQEQDPQELLAEAKLPPIPSTPSEHAPETPPPAPSDEQRIQNFKKTALLVKNQTLNQLATSGIVSRERAQNLTLITEPDKVMELLKGLYDLIASGMNNSSDSFKVERFPDLKIDKDLIPLFKEVFLEPSGAVRLDDVIGQDEAVRELRALAIQLTDPDSVRQHGLDITKGYLLAGPQGVGKTMAATGVSNEVSCPMLHIKRNNIFHGIVGSSEQKIHDIFRLARQVAASNPTGKCLLFIDEIDSIAIRRDRDVHEVTKAVLNILLDEMDGIQSDDSVIVLGATNMPSEVDGAFLGRLERKIDFVLPNAEVRIKILQNDFARREKKAGKALFSKNLDWEKIGSATIHWAGRQLDYIAEQALKKKWWSNTVDKVEGGAGNVTTSNILEIIDGLDTTVMQTLLNQGLKKEAIELMEKSDQRKNNKKADK